MHIVAIIQARMGSTRLPGKVLLPIGEETMLSLVVRRAQQVTHIDQVVVATTDEPADNLIVAECTRLGIPCYRGSEGDVLDRYYQTAVYYHADVVVRITSDCPLIEPEIIDNVIATFLREKTAYANNFQKRTFPHGLDTEVMTFRALATAWNEATEAYQRIHVTPYLYLNPDKFSICSIHAQEDYSNYRWTVDTPEDMEFMRAVYTHFPDNSFVNWKDLLALMTEYPELLAINNHIQQKKLHEG